MCICKKEAMNNINSFLYMYLRAARDNRSARMYANEFLTYFAKLH
jgi:hypothetical protein